MTVNIAALKQKLDDEADICYALCDEFTEELSEEYKQALANFKETKKCFMLANRIAEGQYRENY